MTFPIVVFLVLVASMTSALVLWAANIHYLRSTGRGVHWSALVPPWTVLYAWRSGARYLPVLFVLAVATYALAWAAWTGLGVP